MNLKSNALHMAVGFLGMGAWAVFANRHHPLPQALLAGLVQGTMSAIITLFLKRMIEALSQRLQVAKNYMFIATPGHEFPHRLDDLGGVRLIL